MRVVLSGHVHQHFEASDDGIALLGAPATFSQLRHGGDPHYTDTGEPPGAQILDLHDDGDFDRHIVLAARCVGRVAWPCALRSSDVHEPV